MFAGTFHCVICLWKFHLPKIKNKKKYLPYFVQIIAWQKEESKAEQLKQRSQSSVEDERHEIFLLVGTLWPKSCPKEFDAINAI